MQLIKARGRQTLIDIAVQECGSVEACIDVAQANGLSITDELVTGQAIITTNIVQAETVNLFFKENRQPANASVETFDEDDTLGGIGNWKIETEFVVS
jgi:hypothetical protein